MEGPSHERIELLTAEVNDDGARSRESRKGLP
jgi:hypothetical protein